MTDYIHDEWCNIVQAQVYSQEGAECNCYVCLLEEKDERIAELEARVMKLRRIETAARKLAGVERNQYEACYVPEIEPFLKELDAVLAEQEKEDADSAG